MSRRLFILGSTGSIGQSAIEVILHLRNHDGEGSWPVIGLAAHTNCSLLEEQANLLGAGAVSHHGEFRSNSRAVYGSAVELIQHEATKGDLVLAAIVGFAGVEPVLAAIELGCDIALANKETLVACGQLVMSAARRAGVRIIPVDSEHSAIHQALSNRPHREISKITLTASGGSLRKYNKDELQNATVQQVLNHPTWDMGAKVTVDSASLMNKALELVEAHWLFDIGGNKLEAVIHPQSIVHGMVEFIDGSVIAQLSPPDMKLPIQYALTWPQRVEGCCSTMNWSERHMLQFEEIDDQRYPAVRLAYQVIQEGGTAGAVFNAANEVVVASFLEQSLPFGSMVAIVEEVVQASCISEYSDYSTIIEADQEARAMATELVSSHKVNS